MMTEKAIRGKMSYNKIKIIIFDITLHGPWRMELISKGKFIYIKKK